MLLTLLAVLPAVSLATFIVPLPNGPYGVSIQQGLITDYSLPDPYLNLTYRRVPVSIISPTGSSADCEPVLQPYMPTLVGRLWEKTFWQNYHLPLNNTFTQTNLTLCKPTELNYTTPVVLFAPGAGASRYLYNILAASIVAQTGYTLITYDAPGQTAAVVFPDGSIQYAVNATVANTYSNIKSVSTVVKDGLIVLDAIYQNTGGTTEDKTNITSSPALPRSLTNVTQSAFIGHSQGGAVALVGLLVDDRLSAASNMDGGLNATTDTYAVCHNTDTNTTDCTDRISSKPFLFLQHQNNSQATADGWAGVWADTLRGNKWQVQLNGSAHATYGDYAYLVALYGTRELPGVDVALVDLAVGSVPGTEVPEILSDVYKAFLGYAFAADPTPAVDRVNDTVAQLAPFGLTMINQTLVG